ncbi:MAG: hypothetical protein ACM359_02075 [Bacillota bacterium]
MRAGVWKTRSIVVCLFMLMGAGCQQYPVATLDSGKAPQPGLSGPVAISAVRAICEPPAGWMAKPLEMNRGRAQQTWVSPSGSTAYGVIAFRLPLPVGSDLALWGFLGEMRKQYSDGRLLSKKADPTLPGVRFLAEGGPYRLRTNLILHGASGWAVYAGTLRDRPEDPDELKLAERARESTAVGLIEQAAR